ncbi:MAG TPA: catecholate siderophore receptor Fiu [Rhodanobacteraceae bacterium]|nr:catecholate siderophore receptor Fiu [Rhodanobacteraceae bacterium]
MSVIRHRKHQSSCNPGRAFQLSTLMAGIALGLPALAANADAADTAAGAGAKAPTQLPTINVTATRSAYKVDRVESPKFSQPILDTPQTIQVIDRQVIAQQGATTLSEALRNSPGVGTFYVGENGSTSTGDAIYMRGFDTSGSIFVDGVRDLGSISRDVSNVEQVEVTKGPDGTGYGRTAPTGAINMVSKQPNLGDQASATLGYGSGGHQRITADWNDALGTHSAFRLNVMGQDSGVPGRDAVRSNRWGVAPSLAFGLGTPTRMYLDILHVSQNNVPDGGVPTIGLPGYSSPDPMRPFLGAAPAVDASNFYGTDADHDRVKADMFTVIVRHEFSGAVALHDTFRWGRTHEDYLLTSFRGDGASLVTPDPADPSTWTIARSLPTFKDQTNRILTNQTNLTASFGTGTVRHDLSVGIELAREEIATGGTGALDDSAWTPANLYDPDPRAASGLVIGNTGAWSRGRTDTAAAYAFDTLHFGEHWLVTAGARIDHYDTDFRSVEPCESSRRAPACDGAPTATPLTAVIADKGGNLHGYKLGIVYKPVERGSVYANFATSAEPPGGNSLEFSSSARSADNPGFDPQKARTIEVGTKWDVAESRLRVTAALYRTVVGNLVTQDPVDLQYYQVGRQRVQGIELGAVGQLTPNWALSAGYTLMEAKVTRGQAVAENGSADLPYTPKSAFTAWSTWRLPRGFLVGAGARYSGRMERGQDGAVGTPASTEAYRVFDAMASYRINRHATLQLNLYNLFDEAYVAAINKSGYRYTPGTPRSALLTLNLRF